MRLQIVTAIPSGIVEVELDTRYKDTNLVVPIIAPTQHLCRTNITDNTPLPSTPSADSMTEIHAQSDNYLLT